MAKKGSAKKKASKKKVAKPVARKSGGKAKAQAKAKTKVVAKKKTTKKKVAVKKKPKASSTPKAKKTAKRKAAVRHPPLDMRRIRKQLRERQAELLQAYMSTKDSSRSREVDGTEDYIDYAVSSYDREFLLSLTELEQNQLSLVDAAIERLGSGAFGLCTQCERPIPTKRLEVQPWAQFCLRCQELADQGIVADDDDSPSGEDEDPADAEDDEARDEDRLVGAE
jgi:DnaK suppressor protein